MATAQMTRQEELTGTWASMFPVEQVTEQQSSLFAKKLLAVAISNITYLRAIFPEPAYGDRCLGDLNLKILRDDSAYPGASQVIKWVKGCFDALDKKYLRLLIIGIYVDPQDPNTVIESYTFKFSYSTQCGVDIYRNGKKITSVHSTEKTKKETIQLLRTIIVLTQSLQPLPDNVMMTMKLLYYDEVTPVDYEPPGFKPSTQNSFQFDEEPVNIKLGDVSTPFHSVKMRIKTDKQQFDYHDDEAEESSVSGRICSNGLDKEHEAESQKGAQKDVYQFQDEPMEKDLDADVREGDVPVVSPGMPGQMSCSNCGVQDICPVGVLEDLRPCISVELHTFTQKFKHINTCTHTDTHQDREENKESHICLSTEKGRDARTPSDNVHPEDEFKVQCPCGCNEDDGLMIVCDLCNLWQHAVCFGILDEDHAPEEHLCDKCAKAADSERKATDPYLNELNSFGVQATCLWRRALVCSAEFTRILAPALGQRLGVDTTVAQGLINRLEKEGFVRAPNKGRRLGKVVDKEKVLNEGIPSYFKSSKQPEKKNAENKNTLEKPLDTDETNRGRTRQQTSSERNTDISHVTEKTANITLTGLPSQSTASSKKGQRVQESKDSSGKDTLKDGQSRRGRKRVFSKVDQTEFDLCNSQDGYDTRSRRKKCSDVQRSVVV